MASPNIQRSLERERQTLSGWTALVFVLLWFVATAVVIASTISGAADGAMPPATVAFRMFGAMLMVGLGMFFSCGFFTLEPNEARVLILFGDYKGTARGSGFHQVGQRLAAVSDRKLPYEFTVLNNSIPNAWALPGGKIGVNRGRLTQLKSESELAAVLGHEIVHAAARHSAQQMSRGMLLQGGLIAAQVGASDSDYGSIYAAGAGVAAQLLMQRYGREAELEADKYGIDYMRRAGYDANGAVSLQETFVRMKRPQGQRLACRPVREPSAVAGTARRQPAAGCEAAAGRRPGCRAVQRGDGANDARASARGYGGTLLAVVAGWLPTGAVGLATLLLQFRR